MKVTVVMVSVFFSVLFAGCRNGHAMTGETSTSSRDRDAVATQMIDASVTASRIETSIVEKELDPWPWDDLRLRAGLGMDAGRGWMEPTARRLAANTCNDRDLRLSPEIMGWARDGHILWHMCYRTPTPDDSSHPLAHQRPTSVVLQFFHEGSRSLREIIELEAPARSDAQAWTVNFVVALPPNVRPFFNLENRYASLERLTAAHTENDQEELHLRGVLRMWRVYTDGRQDLSPPGIGCLARSINLPRRDCFFVPHLACPDGFEGCRLGAYECCDWYELSL